MNAFRLSALVAVLGWAMLPLAFPPSGEPVDGDRVVGGLCGETCGATVACPRCFAAATACRLRTPWLAAAWCQCTGASRKGCMGVNPNHPDCVWDPNPLASCNASLCGNEIVPSCTLAFAGCPTPCFCVASGFTCPFKC